MLLSAALAAAPRDATRAEQIHLAADIYSTGTGRVDEAAGAFQQARELCEAGDVGAALRLATVAACNEPDNADARRVLGYRRIGAHWAGSYAARRLAAGETWHPQFGWIKAEDLPRYQAGERPWGRRWISAEEDARRHATIDDGWQVRTDHFRVVTNHSREAAAALAIRLESLYQIWQQQFGGFSLRPADLLQRFAGKEISGYRSKPFEVVYYRTRDEYHSILRRQQPRIEMTLGIYFDTTRKAHFFAGPGQDAGTINHEAVHQFFQESIRSARNVGASSNAWLIEGVACYFESLQEHHNVEQGGVGQGERSFTIGTPTAGRLPAARQRRLGDDFYVPLAELSALGVTDFQRRPDLPRLYSQSAGLATFLMQYQDGVYRPALVESLQLLYAGHDRPSTLEVLTGRSFAELDRDYLRYLKQLPVAAAAP